MVEVKLHDIGEGMHEGEILHFLSKRETWFPLTSLWLKSRPTR